MKTYWKNYSNNQKAQKEVLIEKTNANKQQIKFMQNQRQCIIEQKSEMDKQMRELWIKKAEKEKKGTRSKSKWST